jgi:hypothetical protein
MSDFRLIWHQPLHLNASDELIYEVDHEEIPEEPGIYIFFREHGGTQTPMYVGQAKNLRQRIRGQLKSNVKLMKGIQGSPNGSRKVTFGVYRPGRGQQMDQSLDRIERSLIRHYIESHQLFNTQGTHVPMESLTSDRPQRLNKLIPRTITFQKAP